MNVRFRLSMRSLAEFHWWNILIQPEEIVGIIVRFNGDHAVPSLVVRLGYAVLLVAAHEIDVDARFHRWPKLTEQSANPRNISSIRRGIRPVGKQIHDERSATIAERGLFRCDLRRRSAEIGKFNLCVR